VVSPEHPERPRLLIVGFGDLGQAVAASLADESLQIFGLRRSVCSHSESVEVLVGDVTRPETLTALAALRPEYLLYAVAATAQNDENYRAQYVEGLRNVLHALLPAQSLKHAFFVSSTRVYGQHDDTLLDEYTLAIPVDFGGERLLEAEQLLEGLPCGHTVLRLSGIYGPGRDRLIRLARTPEQWPVQNSWSNRIHRDDAAAFIALLVRRALAHQPELSCYVVTDCQPAPLYEVMCWLAERLGQACERNPVPPVTGGKRLSNAHMLETGFRFRYPDYRAGYTALLETVSR
jgi:nucleoside-diphosphate-sugar epimerase